MALRILFLPPFSVVCLLLVFSNSSFLNFSNVLKFSIFWDSFAVLHNNGKLIGSRIIGFCKKVKLIVSNILLNRLWSGVSNVFSQNWFDCLIFACFCSSCSRMSLRIISGLNGLKWSDIWSHWMISAYIYIHYRELWEFWLKSLSSVDCGIKKSFRSPFILKGVIEVQIFVNSRTFFVHKFCIFA